MNYEVEKEKKSVYDAAHTFLIYREGFKNPDFFKEGILDLDSPKQPLLTIGAMQEKPKLMSRSAEKTDFRITSGINEDIS